MREVTIIIITIGILRQWKPEQLAGVMSTNVTAGSIAILVIDKSLFDKPYFEILVDSKIAKESESTPLPMSGMVSIIVRNMGFRDAYSVQTTIDVLSDDFR
jgi:hypothetical protein